MMMQFLTVTLIGLLMIISPGPDFAILTKTSLSRGRLAGLMAAVGIAVANLCHVGVNLLGVGVIIAQSVMAFTLMKVLGAGYLLYIGFHSLRSRPAKVPEVVVAADASSNSSATNATDNTTPESAGLASPVLHALPASGTQTSSERLNIAKKSFLTGFLTSILNPKACLFYLSLFSLVLDPGTPIVARVFYGVWLSSLALIWFMLVALFFTHPAISAKLHRGKHWIERVTGGVLVGLGLRLLTSELA